MYDNFPEIINMFSSPLMHVFFSPGVSSVVPGGCPQSDTCPVNWWKLAQLVAGCFPVLLPTEWALCSSIGQWFLKKKCCVTSPGAGNISCGNSLSSLRSGFPEPAVCVSEAQLCAPWLPAHLPCCLARCSPEITHWQVNACLLQLQVHLWWRCDEVMPDKIPAYTWLAPFSPSSPDIIPSIFFHKTSCILSSSTFNSSEHPFINPVQSWNAFPLCPITGLMLPVVVSRPRLV